MAASDPTTLMGGAGLVFSLLLLQGRQAGRRLARLWSGRWPAARAMAMGVGWWSAVRGTPDTPQMAQRRA